MFLLDIFIRYKLKMIFSNILKKILRMPAIYRRFLLLFIDTSLILLTPFISQAIFIKGLTLEPFSLKYLLILSFIVAPPIWISTGQYKSLLRHSRTPSLYKLGTRNLIIYVIIFILSNLLSLKIPNINILFIFWFTLSSFSGFIRVLAYDLINLIVTNKSKIKYAIYGAGKTGAIISESLIYSERDSVYCFLDDSKYLIGRSLNGINIYDPSELSKLKNKIDKILICMPNISRKKLRELLFRLQKYSIPVVKIPSINEIANKSIKIYSLKPIAFEEYLGRDSIEPNIELLEKAINNKNLCITGAGGSIGSELTRQIIDLNPKSLVLLDQSEENLYLINEEIKNNIPSHIELKLVLGSTMDKLLIENVFSENNVQIVFHTAAYKHVPLVELNPIKGLENNVLSTKVICQVCAEIGVEKMILISTDKAVRPTNIMGASKRLSELIVQAYSIEEQRLSIKKSIKVQTCFAMVRFGNVLGSSGSVIPKFRKQIEAGEPITLTHPDVVRYFMTIKEASQLVIQSSALAKGGEVFLLDMGEPIKIKDLAIKMIQAEGLSVKNEFYPDGDIEIKVIGLRPGEKLYEELLISAESEPTLNKLIFTARESFIDPEKLWPKFGKLEKAFSNQDLKEIITILSDLIPEWSYEQPSQ
tara:strand:- start:3536 stop:5470 length:1935 start_codon:yes stop_codon:yes gene_type:complete